MAKAYGIFQGQYSDWKCIGYFYDETSAYKYCKMRNQELDDYDRMYVMPIRKIECDLSNIPDGYFEFQFTFHKKEGVWKLFPDYYREPEEDERLIDYISNEDYYVPYIDMRDYSNCSIAFVRICMRTNDMQKARDIAYETMRTFHLETDGGSDG